MESPRPKKRPRFHSIIVNVQQGSKWTNQMRFSKMCCDGFLHRWSHTTGLQWSSCTVWLYISCMKEWYTLGLLRFFSGILFQGVSTSHEKTLECFFSITFVLLYFFKLSVNTVSTSSSNPVLLVSSIKRIRNEDQTCWVEEQNLVVKPVWCSSTSVGRWSTWSCGENRCDTRIDLINMKY